MLKSASDIRRHHVKLKCVLLAVTCVLMSVIPALPAPQAIEDFCFDQAKQVRFSGRGEREAFIANWIANLTATPIKKHTYRKSGERQRGE
jgi:hypothetical protein